jgi:hypothetical protein
MSEKEQTTEQTLPEVSEEGSTTEQSPATIQEQSTTPDTSPTPTIVATTTKNVGLSIILTVILGPLGLFYSSVLGGIIMCLVTIVVGLTTFGLSTLALWPVCMIWAAIAANSHNKALLAGTK